MICSTHVFILVEIMYVREEYNIRQEFKKIQMRIWEASEDIDGNITNCQPRFFVLSNSFL